MTKNIFERLADPFAPEHITWKPGATTKDRSRCLALAYGSLRAYQNRLDEVVGSENWEIGYHPWGESRLIAELTIYPDGRDGNGTRKSAVGETDKGSENNEIGGTVAEAQAFKRACAQFSLGRYLYEFEQRWVHFDAQKRQITDAGKRELAQLVEDHYRSAMLAREFGAYSVNTARFILHVRELAGKGGQEATPQRYGTLTGRLNSLAGSDEARYQVLGVLTGKEYAEGCRVSDLVASKLLEYLDPASKTCDNAREAIREISAGE